MNMKIKVEELMVGDWVCYSEPNGYYVKVSEIRHTSDDESEWYIVGKRDERDPINPGKEDLFSVAIIHPIKATYEIMEKNGFETRPNIGCILDDYDGNVITYDDWNHKLKILVNYNVVFEKEYFYTIAVHELQNVLRVCELGKNIEL